MAFSLCATAGFVLVHINDFICFGLPRYLGIPKYLPTGIDRRPVDTSRRAVAHFIGKKEEH